MYDDIFDNFPVLDDDDIDVMINAEAVPIDYGLPVFVEDDVGEVTPMKLLNAYNAKQGDYKLNTFSFRFRVAGRMFTMFELFSSTLDNTFLNGHPCGKLSPGSLIKVHSYEVESFTVEVKEIIPEKGQIVLTKRLMLPYFTVDNLGGDVEKQKHHQILQKLSETWDEPGSLSKDIFSKVAYSGTELLDSHKLGLIHGVVGSGKTYACVTDVKRLKAAEKDSPCVIMAGTNSALLSIYNECVSQRLRAVQFTNKEMPHSFQNVFKDEPVYQRFQKWRGVECKTKEDRADKARDLDAMREILKNYVVLFTPSRAFDYRNVYRMADISTNFFVDEAGLMTFLNACVALTYKLKRLYAYGDYKQLSPWEERHMDISPQDIDFVRIAKLITQAGDQSLASWLADMYVPVRKLPLSRRLPLRDAAMIVPFFYDLDVYHSQIEPWISDKMIVPKKYFNRNTHYVPDALASYPWLKNELKEREAIRMHAMFHYVNDNPDIFKDMGSIMVITPYTHLADSLKQLYEKFYTALGLFLFTTTRKSQGMTVHNVIFLTLMLLHALSMINRSLFLGLDIKRICLSCLLELLVWCRMACLLCFMSCASCMSSF